MTSKTEQVDLEYKVERNGGVYVVRVNNAHLISCGNVYGDLYLDKIEGSEKVRLWKPKMLNPFNSEIKERDVKVSDFCIDDVRLNWSSLDDLIKEIDYGLVHKYEKGINSDDAKAFFSQVYDNYKKIDENIQI